MTAVFYAAGAVLVAVGLCIGARLMYSLGKQSAVRQIRRVRMDSPTDCGSIIVEVPPRVADAIQALQAKADRLDAQLQAAIEAANATIAEQREELAETDRALAALRTSVEQHRASPRTLAGRPAVLTPEQRELAAEDAAWKRSQDGAGDV